MELLDFIPEEYLHYQFALMNERTLSMLPSSVSIVLRITGDNNLRIRTTATPDPDGRQSYAILVSKDLIEFITRYFFGVARCAGSINGVEIPNPQPSGITHRWIPELERIEAVLNTIPADLDLDEQRTDLFLALIEVAWDLLLFHETAHITEGHINFMRMEPQRFKADAAYSRSCEIQADETAHRWLRERMTCLTYAWIKGAQLGNAAYSKSSQFSAFVASTLFLKMRVNASTFGHESDQYLPREIRHRLAIRQILQEGSFETKETLYDAMLLAEVEALRIFDLVMGWPERTEKVLFVDIPPEEQQEYLAKAIVDYERLRGEWTKYQPTQRTD
ncbi:hypothetical protein FHT87_006053 [Rhizobium sp. BK316]|uniref:hypothetical protein n=1 Tax=Rhizobium sp. BK316 TaxID=2587053 RepID=UPI001616D48E|nr:hypothetical protein [Rhizobium sp. BK316]MBB3412083.1 hypothetical protein [Rhizobium sp. BK316]